MVDKSWPAVWQDLRNHLVQQPPCPDHHVYPHVRTVGQRVINDIINVRENELLIRSHRTLREDFIEEAHPISYRTEVHATV